MSSLKNVFRLLNNFKCCFKVKNKENLSLYLLWMEKGAKKEIETSSKRLKEMEEM